MTSLRKSQPKLKDSCDNCAAAKVRCGKEKPACHRCHEKAHSCNYSYSCRAGRHLVKGDRNSPPLGKFGTPSVTSSPTFSYPIPMDSPAGYSDSLSSYSLAGSQSHMADSFGGIYANPMNYPYLSGSYTQMPYSLSSDDSIESQEMPLNYGYPSRKQSRSESQSSSTSTLGISNLSLGSSHLTTSSTPEQQWRSSDPTYLGYGTTTCLQQYMMGQDQNCLQRLHALQSGQVGRHSQLTDFHASEYPSGMLGRAPGAIDDPIAFNKNILDHATNTLTCSCSYNDRQVQQLLLSVAYDILARYSSVAFGGANPQYERSRKPSSRAGRVLDELHRVAAFLDHIDERVQNSRSQSQYGGAGISGSTSRRKGSSFSGIPELDPRDPMDNSSSSAYAAAAMGAMPSSTSIPYSSYSSASSSSSGIASSSDLALVDSGFSPSPTELRRRLEALRAEICRRMTTN